MKALVLVENKDAALELTAGARKIADEVILVCLGHEAISDITDRILHIEIPEENIIEDAYLTLFDICDSESASLVFVEATRGLKALAGRLSAHMGTAALTDIVEFSDGVATNMYFGGVALRKTKTMGETVVCTVGRGVFCGDGVKGDGVVEVVPFKAPDNAVKREKVSSLPQSGGDLPAAETVVAVGRGFSERADLDLASELCSLINAEMACSRPLTEGLDWMPKGTYIGVSGLMLNPKVYIGIGISGQMQHMVGCARAGTIFAINKDANAPIFKQCDYGIVGDLKAVLPLLNAAF